MKSIKEKENKAFDTLKEKFGYTNRLQAPRIVKVVVSSGVGTKKDKRAHEVIPDRLAKITGQKPAPRGAKKSISTFKLRQGDVIGYQVTLRGKRMYDFLEKLINVAYPRTKDFRGLKTSSVDNIGNITLGLREHSVFPETTDEELRDVFGMAVTVVSTAKNKKEATAFFETLGVPFEKAKVE